MQMSLSNFITRTILALAVAVPVYTSNVGSADARHKRTAIIAGAIIGGAIAYGHYKHRKKYRKHRYRSYGYHRSGYRYRGARYYGRHHHRGHTSWSPRQIRTYLLSPSLTG